MKILLKLFFVPFVFLFVHCKEEKKIIKYDNQYRLEKIVKNLVQVELNKSGKNSVVIILQSEDCICTDENMVLAKDVLSSNKYVSYLPIVITKGKKHKFLSLIPASITKSLKLYSDTSNYLFSHGYITTTDRIIIYENGSPTYFEDMHITKPAEIRKKIL